MNLLKVTATGGSQDFSREYQCSQQSLQPSSPGAYTLYSPERYTSVCLMLDDEIIPLNYYL